METYAIIGGAGFIGSHFVDNLLSQGNKVLVIDNFSSGTISHIETHLCDPNFRLIEESVERTSYMIKHLQDIDVVIHLASNPDIAAAIANPRIDFTHGTVLTESVLEAVRIAGVKKFLYASGSGVYGEVPFRPVSEDELLQPVSPYGASKLAGESLLSAYSYMFELNSIAFRFANVVGPRQTHGVGYDFIRKLRLNPTELRILGDGSQTKSYIHVLDVVSAVLHLTKSLHKHFDVFNISTDDTLSVIEIAKIAVEVMGLEEKRVNFVFEGGDRGWKGDVPKIILNSEKIRKSGWSPIKSSYEAIQESLRSMSRETSI